MMNTEKSCGAVVFTRECGGIRYVLVRQLEGFYGFPKGHVQSDETELETARREIREEIGVDPVFMDGFRMIDEHPLPQKPGTIKQIIYFLAEYAGQDIRFQPEELLDASLFSYGEALSLLTYASSKRLLAQANDFLRQSLNRGDIP